MECLRVKLYTPTGIFKNPLSIKGIEVYPLPPYSTIIGLIYRAMGRKWNGEHFQISIQGDYQAIYRDYVWFRGDSLGDKEDKLPLQVPILYSLELLVHVKAENGLLEDIERALKEPKELLFLSGGEYPVKVQEVKRVKCLEKFLSEENCIKLNYNAYIQRELLENIGTSDKGILFSLSYFYKNSQKPKTYSWIDAYYFQKGTEIYGSLIFDEDNNPVFLAEPTTEELKKSEGEEYVRFYAGNWLMASACVGVLKVLENAREDIEKYVEERSLTLPKELWQRLPELYAEYLLKDAEHTLRASYEKEKDKSKFNPYNVIILRSLGDFYKNSPFTNPALSYITKLKGVSIEDINQVKNQVKSSFIEGYEYFLSKAVETSQTCFFCHERQAKNFVDATNFTPLFASIEKRRNLFWDLIPICKECEFLLYFASAGFYRSAGKYLFVYVPDDLLETYRLNLILSTEKEIEQEKLGRVWSVVRYVLDLEKQKSIWVLQNIYFVEIEKVGNNPANIYSFHISPNLAEAIRKLIDHYPKNLQDIFSEFLFYIYTGRSLYEFLFLLLSGFIKKDSYKNLQGGTIESKIVQAGRSIKYISQNLLFFINFQEVLNMNMNEQKGYIDRAFWAGRELKKLYKENESTQKKLEPLTYRLLEAIR
ncbi:type I-B CRISPR-associated protein Cas5b, partial [Thermocrinis sp.]|uniref:type I-B CRISPR-associated protein Cas5b n=1 Tax=Thermocrinis sp. TaxID=2024383 RepID=UPI003C0BF9BC